MKKTMSRLISALLVIAMVCAMVPAAFAAVTSVTITGAPSGEVEIGYTGTLAATVNGDEGTSQNVTWASSNPAVVSVSGGAISALSAGTATITATSTEDTTKSGSCTITVKAADVAVTGVSLNQSSATLTVGETVTLTATVAPNTASNKNVTWTSSNDAVATVAGGVVTAVSSGSATITAASAADSTKTASCTVTVNKRNLTISPTQLLEKTVAVGTDISALGLPTTGEITVSGSTKATYSVEWSSVGYSKNVKGDYTLNGTASLSAADAAKYNLTTTAVTALIHVTDKPTVAISGTRDLIVKKGETNAGNKTLAPTFTKNPTDAELTIKWAKSSNKNGPYTEIPGAVNETYTVDVTTPGKTYYVCNAMASKNGVNGEWEQSAVMTVEVVDQYRITLETNKGASSSDAAVVGTNPTIQATVEEYKDGQFKPVNGGTISWTVNVSNTFATISTTSSSLSSTGKNSATLTTIGTRDRSVMKVTVTATVYGTYTQDIDIYVKPGAAETITFQTVGGGATFSEDKFWTAVAYATNSRSIDFDYVKFDTPTDGYLYTDSSAKTSVSSKECYYDAKNSQVDLDGLYFVPKTNAKKPSVDYTAYNTLGTVIAYGTVSIGGSSGDINYETSYNQSVSFDEDDFQKFFAAAYSKGSLDYVNFNVDYDDNLNTRAYGYLYESTDKNADYVDKKTDYHYDASSRQADLDGITFTAGTRTTKYTITVPFTAYGTKSGSSSTVSVDGYVTITVNDGKATTIYSTGTSFKGDIYKAMIPDNYTEREVSGFYVDFGTVTGGKLFYDYKSIAEAKEVTSKTTFFFDAAKNELDLEDVYFVPEAGVTSAKVAYEIYDGKSKVDSGVINFTVIQQTKSNSFSDVTESNTGKWSANSVDFMYSNGLVTGTGSKTFSPKQTMTRAMLVTILYRVAGQPSVKSVSNPFSDVKSGTYYYDAVLWAYKNDVVTGNSKTTFNPNGAVTREQIAAILYRYAGKPKTSSSLRGYTDTNKISSYATEAMTWAVGSGIITGKSASTLDPTGNGTRAEVAVMLHRYLTK